jgi:DNA-binding CsgD family transcriptional regulator
MSEASAVCGARRASAVQRTILRCEGAALHHGEHGAHTEWGRAVSWSDLGRMRFAAGQGRVGRPISSTGRSDPAAGEAPETVLSTAALRHARTERHREVLRLLVAGGDLASIASALGVGETAVRSAIRTLTVRFGTSSVETMIRLASGGSEGEAGGVLRPA